MKKKHLQKWFNCIRIIIHKSCHTSNEWWKWLETKAERERRTDATQKPFCGIPRSSGRHYYWFFTIKMISDCGHCFCASGSSNYSQLTVSLSKWVKLLPNKNEHRNPRTAKQRRQWSVQKKQQQQQQQPRYRIKREFSCANVVCVCVSLATEILLRAQWTRRKNVPKSINLKYNRLP